jgi:hypothetical protein
MTAISIRSADKRQAVRAANNTEARLIFLLLQEGNAAGDRLVALSGRCAECITRTDNSVERQSIFIRMKPIALRASI